MMRKLLLSLLLIAGAAFGQVTTNPARTGIPTDPGSVNGIVQGNGSGTASAVTIGTGLSYSGGTLTSTATGGRTQLTGDKTYYVRVAPKAASFTNGSANITVTAHGLLANDPVVFSLPANRGTATVTIASPGVFTRTAHGYAAGQPLRIDTTGALPTGLPAAATPVYVIAAGLTANAFQVSLTPGGAAINTTGSQSGTHYVSMVGAMPTFSVAGLLTVGTPYYVKTVVDANTITISQTAGGAAAGTATVAANGTPTYQISTGNDSNDGSAADRAHAFLTINAAINKARDTLDMQGHCLNVLPQESTYDEGVQPASLVGISTDNSIIQCANIIGQTGNYTGNVLIRPSGAGAVPIFPAPYCNTPWSIDKVAVDTTLSATSATFAAYGSSIELYHFTATLGAGTAPIAVQDKGRIEQNQSIIVLADSGLSNFIFAYEQGEVITMAPVVLLNAPTGTAFVDAELGSLVTTYFSGSSGTFTGPQFNLVGASSLNTGGLALSSVPGTSQGVIDLSSSVNGQLGATTTNDNAGAGFMGEFAKSCVAAAAGVSLTNNTSANVTSLALTAGDWDVGGNINFAGTTATVTGGSGGINTTSATLPTDGSEVYDGTVTTALSDNSTITLARNRVSLAASGTAYLVANKSFSAGTVKAFGCLTVRRVR